MLRLGGILIAAGALLAGAACAQDAPPQVPTRDVAVSYKLIGRGGPKTLVIRQRAQSRIMRIETVGQPGYVLVNRQTQRTTIVMQAQGVVADMPANQVPQEGQLPDGKASFTRHGSTNIAGTACTNWDYVTPRGDGTMCVTDDGVMLRIEALSGNGLEATNVSFAPQQIAWFTAPAGMRKTGSAQPLAPQPSTQAAIGTPARPASAFGGAPTAPLASVPGVPGYAAPAATAPTVLPGGITLPPGVQLPPGLKIPPNLKLPRNFKLPPGVQLPAGMTLPSSN